MPISESAREHFHLDWLISNLRWLLLVSVALVIFLDTFTTSGAFFDTASILPQVVLLTVAALYNLLIMLLDRNTQGAIFYIIEEAISNARKHAKASNVWVRLYIQNSSFVAEAEDDGCGFDVDAIQVRYDERNSLGMVNMHERAELIGGALTISSAPGEGTRVRLSVPLQRR